MRRRTKRSQWSKGIDVDLACVSLGGDRVGIREATKLRDAFIEGFDLECEYNKQLAAGD